jgi:hypothetical protein
MAHTRHIVLVLLALLVVFGGPAPGSVSLVGPDTAATTAPISGCDHCPDADIPSDRLCAMACATTAAIMPDAFTVHVTAGPVSIEAGPVPVVGRDCRPDPYPPRFPV